MKNKNLVFVINLGRHKQTHEMDNNAADDISQKAHKNDAAQNRKI